MEKKLYAIRETSISRLLLNAGRYYYNIYATSASFLFVLCILFLIKIVVVEITFQRPWTTAGGVFLIFA